jgi:hypothetical protein
MGNVTIDIDEYNDMREKKVLYEELQKTGGASFPFCA